MPGEFFRHRRRILAHLAQHLGTNDLDDALARVRQFCKARRIQATDRDIQSVVNEAFQARVVKRLKQLNSKIDSFHPPP